MSDPCETPVAELRREMGFSHADFFRTLRQLPAGWLQATRVDGVSLSYANGRVEITLGPQRERRIALLRLPQTEVIFRYIDLAAAERAAFQARFDLTFHRGGG